MSEKPTIMFVDDEERILRSLKMMFRNKYEVLTTTTGQEALQMMRQIKVHVLVSDQRMPAMLGVDLLRQAKTVSPKTMRMLLTGYADKEAVIGSINEGEIFRYISKPWKSDDIRTTIAEATEIALSADSEDIMLDEPAIGKQVVVVLDEDPYVAEFISGIVTQDFGDSHRIEWCTAFDQVTNTLSQGDVTILITELNFMGDDMGIFIKKLKEYTPNIVTIVTSSFQDVNTLVGLVNEGQIYRFLPKPLRRGMIAMALKGAFHHYNAMKNRPALMARHKVKPTTQAVETSSLAGRVMGIFRNKQRAAG